MPGSICRGQCQLPGDAREAGVLSPTAQVAIARLARPIYMLVDYPKSKKDDLSDKDTVILRELVKET